MITFDSALMDFNPFTAVEEKLNMKVTQKGDTFTFKFSNGYKKIKTLKNETEVRKYYSFLEAIYNDDPKHFPGTIENILKGKPTGEHVSIRFKETQNGDIRCKVEVSFFNNGERVMSAAKTHDKIYNAYIVAKRNLEKKMSRNSVEPEPEPEVIDSKSDFINYLVKQLAGKDKEISELKQEIEVLEISLENACEKVDLKLERVIMKYTTCPVCGGEMIVKESSQGHRFIGCSEYENDKEAHKTAILPYDSFAKMLVRRGIIRDYQSWRYDL